MTRDRQYKSARTGRSFSYDARFHKVLINGSTEASGYSFVARTGYSVTVFGDRRVSQYQTLSIDSL